MTCHSGQTELVLKALPCCCTAAGDVCSLGHVIEHVKDIGKLLPTRLGGARDHGVGLVYLEDVLG